MPPRFSGLKSLFCALVVPCSVFAQSDLPVIETAAAVRALAPQELAKRLPVRIEGIITDSLAEHGAMQDATSGIGIHLKEKRALPFGERAIVRGVTSVGNFAPTVEEAVVELLGPGELPPPRVVGYDQLITGDLDCEWVEVEGTVRGVSSFGGMLEVALGSGRILVEVVGLDVKRSRELFAARVRVRGIVFYRFNRKRQLYAVRVKAPSQEKLEVLRPPSAAPAGITPLSDILRFAPGMGLERVRMQGMVMAQRGTTFFLKDESGGVRVEINKSAWPSLGDQVEVLGFPILRNHQPVLEDATCEPRGKAESPVPKLFSTHLLIDQDAEFVSCRGVLRAVATTESEVVLTLHTSEGDFLARLPRSNAGEPPEWIVESEMQLQGICDVNMELSAGLQEGKQADSFQLLLRGPADVVVLSQPPWWSRPRVLRGISVAAGLFVCLLGALLLRARSRVRQEAQRRAFSEAQFTAILTERSRLARDIHDTLAQGFTAISVHLETIRHGLNSSPEIAMYHLEMARQLVQSSLVEARRAIWRMRSQVIENASLAEAVDQLGSRLAEANGLKFLTHVSGRQLRLSPLVENDLLRIAQEAMTNVVRHARAKSLTVTWTYAPGEVALSVSDDGMGFVPTSGAVGSAVTGGFGIAGMRERAALLNASIDFISAPGKGTEMRLLVPVPGPVLELTTVT